MSRVVAIAVAMASGLLIGSLAISPEGIACYSGHPAYCSRYPPPS